ncbi:MAG: cytochrome PufQ [Pseudomonadota bacterium]|mgnify:CR=1 FL=1
MADMTSNPPVARPAKPPRTEFWIYFALIFIASLPLGFVASIAGCFQRGVKNKGPVARAWSQACVITPRIFSA